MEQNQDLIRIETRSTSMSKPPYGNLQFFRCPHTSRYCSANLSTALRLLLLNAIKDFSSCGRIWMHVCDTAHTLVRSLLFFDRNCDFLWILFREKERKSAKWNTLTEEFQNGLGPSFARGAATPGCLQSGIKRFIPSKGRRRDFIVIRSPIIGCAHSHKNIAAETHWY